MADSLAIPELQSPTPPQASGSLAIPELQPSKVGNPLTIPGLEPAITPTIPAAAPNAGTLGPDLTSENPYKAYIVDKGQLSNAADYTGNLPGAIANAAGQFTGMLGRDIAHSLPPSAAKGLQDAQLWATGGRPDMPNWSRQFYEQLGHPSGARWEDGAQGAAEGMRDVGLTALGAMAPGIAGALGAMAPGTAGALGAAGTAGALANIGVPAVMEASGANQIIPGVGELAQHLTGSSEPQYDFDPAEYQAQPTPGLKQAYLDAQLAKYQGQLGLNALFSPEASQALFQSGLMGAGMAAERIPQRPGAEPVIGNAQPLGEPTNRVAPPADSSLFRSAAKAAGADFLRPSPDVNAEKLAAAPSAPWDQTPMGKDAADQAIAAKNQLMADRNSGRVLANSAFDEAQRGTEPVEDRYAKQIMQATPRLPTPADGADLTTPEGQSQRYQTYLADALDKMTQRRGTSELMPHEAAAAQAIALGRMSEDMSAQNGIVSNPANFNNNPEIKPEVQDQLNALHQQGLISQPNLNAALQELRLNPANLAAPETNSRPSGLALSNQRAGQIEDLNNQINPTPDQAKLDQLRQSIARQQSALPANPRADVAAAARLAPNENLPAADASAKALTPEERGSSQAMAQQTGSKAYKVLQAAFDALPEDEQAARVRLAAAKQEAAKMQEGPNPDAVGALVKARDALQAVSDQEPAVTQHWLALANEAARLDSTGARGYARAVHPSVLAEQAARDLQQTQHGNVSAPTASNLREQAKVYGARQDEAGRVLPQTDAKGVPILVTADGQEFQKADVPGLVAQDVAKLKADPANADLSEQQLQEKAAARYDGAKQKTITERPALEASTSLKDQLEENVQTAITTRFFNALKDHPGMIDDGALDKDGPKGSGDPRRDMLRQAGWRFMGDESTKLSPVNGELAGKWMHPDLYDAWKPQQEARQPSVLKTLSDYIVSRPVRSFANIIPWVWQKNLMASIAFGLPMSEWGNVIGERGRNAANDPKYGPTIREAGFLPEARPAGRAEAIAGREQPAPPADKTQLPSGSVTNPDLQALQKAQLVAKNAKLNVADHLVNFLNSVHEAAASATGLNLKGVAQNAMKAVGAEPGPLTERLPGAVVPAAQAYRSPGFAEDALTHLDDLQNAGVLHWLLDRENGAGLDKATALKVFKENFLFPSESTGLARGLQANIGKGGLGTRYANWTVNATAQYAHLLTNANLGVAARAWAIPAALLALKAGVGLHQSQQQLQQQDQEAAKAKNPLAIPELQPAPGMLSGRNVSNAWETYQDRQAVRPDRLQFPNNLLHVDLGAAPDSPGSDRHLEADVSRYMPYDTAFNAATSVRNTIDHPLAMDSEHNLLSNFMDLSPFTRPVMDLVRNQDAWRGGPIVDPALPANHPQNVKNVAEYMGGSFLPSNFPGGSQDVIAGHIKNEGGPTNVYGASGMRIDRPQLALNNMTGLRVAGTSMSNDQAAMGQKLKAQAAAVDRLPTNPRYSVNDAADLATGGAEQLQNLLRRYRLDK